MSTNNSTNTDVDNTSDTEPATKHDVGIGGGLGVVGGAVVGALAGGPVGAIIGAIAGGAASAAAVDVVDKHDHDYERTTGHDTAAVAPATSYTDDTLADTATTGRATEYTGPGDFQRTAVAPAAAGYVGTTGSDAVIGSDTAVDDYAGTTASASRADDTDQTVRLHAEELHASTQPVQTGEVTLHKEVITENRSIDVPVTREEVVIERHAVSGAATTADFGTATDEVIRVPVMEEQVTIEKTPIVTEEISLGKRQVTETQHVTDTVRHEEARIENADNVDVIDRTSQSR